RQDRDLDRALRKLLGRERWEARILESGAQSVLGHDAREVAIGRERTDAAAQVSLLAERDEESSRLAEGLRLVGVQPGRALAREVRLEGRARQVEEVLPRLFTQGRRDLDHVRTPAGLAAQGLDARKRSIASSSASSRPAKKWSAPGMTAIAWRSPTKRS